MQTQAPFAMQVLSIRRMAENVVSIDLAAPSGGTLPQWAPGAHIDLHLPSGRLRKYSLCGAVTDRGRYRISVLRQGAGGVSDEIHDRLAVGAVVQVSGPLNHFPLLPAPGYLFLAGGIGITPLLPMIAAAQQQGVDWRLLYVGRGRGGMAHLEDLAAYGDRVRVVDTSDCGRPDLGAELGARGGDDLIYCCGPEALMEAVQIAARALGRADRLKTERFGAPVAAAASGAAIGFEEVCARSGISVMVPPQTSLATALEQAGVECGLSCGEGYCGACMTRVVAGEADHRDSFLTPEEYAEGFMTPCVSRARGAKIILDL